MSQDWENDEVIQRLREYLRIPSVHPDADYSGCVKFLKRQAEEIGIPVSVYEYVPKKPVVVMTWTGEQPHLPAILLNSHMDVVPVSEACLGIFLRISMDSSVSSTLQDQWTHPPFEAHVTEDGWIYARGSQDMKSVGMLHLETVRSLKRGGVRLKRTVHLSFVPDEEIGSEDGMKMFAKSEEFKKLNVGFELDESGPSSFPDSFYAFNAERTMRQIKVTCKGTPTHGSFLVENTAGEKLYYMIEKFMKYRAQEMEKFQRLGGTIVHLGSVTTVNLTMVEGGVQVNVLPETLSVWFDIRIAPDVDHEEFENMIARWCKEAGEDVSFEYLVKNPQVPITEVDNGKCPFWDAMVKSIGDMGIKIQLKTCAGATDARFVRQQGVPAINLTPIRNTELYIHCHNERLRVQDYRDGLIAMRNIVTAVANV